MKRKAQSKSTDNGESIRRSQRSRRKPTMLDEEFDVAEWERQRRRMQPEKEADDESSDKDAGDEAEENPAESSDVGDDDVEVVGEAVIEEESDDESSTDEEESDDEGDPYGRLALLQRVLDSAPPPGGRQNRERENKRQHMRAVLRSLLEHRERSSARYLINPFITKPSRALYPDYFEYIKNPIDLKKIVALLCKDK